MSTTAVQKKPDLSIITGGKPTFRTVEVVRRAEHDRWDIVEAIQEDVEAKSARADFVPGSGNRLPPEAEQLCSEIADACRGEGADAWKTKTVATLYKVAVAWPSESRVEGATYGAHERLFLREDRQSRLKKLVARSSDGRVNRNDVDLWLSTLKPARLVAFIDGVESAVRSALKNKGKPWTHVAQDDRDEIAHRLRIIANEVENGEFGMPKS